MEEIELDYRLIALELVRSIRNRRIQLGLTQQEVADRVGTSQTVICYLENGKHSPSLDMLVRVGMALDMGLAWWLRW